MHFLCETALLSKSIQTVKKAISASPNAPILSGIHLILTANTLELIGMDLNFQISKKIPVQGKAEGDIVIPVKYFSELVNNLDSEIVEIIESKDGNEITLKSGKGKYALPLLDKTEYPEFTQFEGEKKIELEEEVVRDLINKTIYACSTDETRPLFTGVLMEKKDKNITCVGTNTHRLAIKTIEVEAAEDINFSIIIPARMLKEIMSNTGKDLPETVELSIKRSQIQAKIGELKIISGLIEGAFPDYKRVIPPKFETKVVYSNKEMEKAVKRVSLFSKDDYSIVRFKVEPTKLELTSGGSDIGNAKEEVACQTEGNPLNIAFNSKYVMDILKYAGSDEVTMEMNNALSPACIRPVSEEAYIYIVTPVRVVF